MPRFTRMSKYRFLTTAIIGVISLTALVWPVASMWASHGQTKSVDASRSEAAPNTSAKPDILAKLLAAGSPRAFSGKGNGHPILRSLMQETENMLAPTITATKTDAVFTDVDGDGRADPGDTLKYTVTIANGGTDASNLIFTDTIDPNTTLVGGSVNTSPIANNDSFSVSGNIQITTASGSLTANDIDPDTGTNAGLTTSGPATTTSGGNLTVNANGSFTYNPPAGFEGADSFTYTVTDSGGATGTGTVTLNVSGMIWFVNAAAGGGGDGRLTTPFNCLVGAGCYSGSANDPNDNIFLYSGAYTGGLTLKNNQRVIGQGAGASLSTITGITPPTGSLALPSTGGARPTVTTTAAATSAFTLASGNTFRGFDIGNTTGADIVGAAVGTFTASEMTLSGTGRALDVNGGTLAATFDSITSTSSSTQGIVLQGGVGGSLTATNGTTISGATTQGILISGSTVTASFGNTTVAAGTDGVSLQNNSSGTRTFGTLSITNGSGVGFLHSNGGGLTTVGATTITNPGGRGIDIQNAAASNGVTFANTTSTQSGGTGVNLQNNAGAITFGTLNITPDSGQRGLFSSGSTGTITTTDGTINTPSNVAVEINGTSAASRTPLAMVFTSVSSSSAANGIVLTSTSGTFAVNGTGTTAGTGGTIQNITNRGASFIDANGITLKNMNFTNVGTTNGDDPVNTASTCGDLANGGGGNAGCNAGIHMNNVTGATFDRVVLNGGVQEGINGNNVTTFALSNSSVLNFGDQVRENGIQFRDLKGTNTISNSTVTGNEQWQLLVVGTNSTLTLLTVTGGTYGTSAAPNGVDGIFIQGSGTANMTTSVQNATLSNNRSDGFFATTADTATINATVNGCTISNNGNSGVNVGNAGSSSLKYTITSNTLTNMVGNVININLAGSTGTLQGTVNANNIGTPGVPSSGSSGGGTGIRVSSNGTGGGAIITNITNNIVRGIVGGSGMDIQARDGNTSLNATITGNDVDLVNTTGSNGIIVQSGAASTDTTSVCADIGGAGALKNIIADRAGATLDELRVRNRFAGTTFRLPGYGGAGNDTAAVVAYLQARNTNAGTTTASINGNVFGGGGACTQPSFAGGFADEGFAAAQARNESLRPKIELEPSEFILDGLARLTAWQAPLTSNETSATNEIAAAHQQGAPAASSSSEKFANHASINNQTRPLASAQEERHVAQEDGKAKRDETTGDAAQDGQQQQQGARVKRDKNGRVLSGETITVGAPTGFTLPAAKTITVTFRVTINNVQGLAQVSNQGSVAGSNFGTVLTDDPAVAGAANPTVRIVDHTNVVVASNANPSVIGQNVTFTATLTGVPVRANTLGGTVQFKADGVAIGSPVSVTGAANSGTAQASTSSLSIGTHVITAEYSGDPNFNSNIGTLAGGQVVGKGNTTTAVTSSQNPSVFGQPVTFTATIAPVSPSTGTPSGTVSFTDGGNPIAGCTSVNLSAGQAQCMTSALSVGNHTIAASYGGDTSFNISNGNMTGNPQVVNKASSNVAVTTSQNPSVFGQTVSFTATVAATAPGTGTPSGTVSFLDGGNPIAACTNVALSGGQAICMNGALGVGNHTITAAYSGDGSFNTSNGSLTGNPQVVNKASTSVGLTSATNPSVFGQSVSFTATVAVTGPGAGTPSGTVQFLDGGNPITGCTSVAVAAGQAVCSSSALAVGNHTITASYSGDGNFNTSNGSLTGNPQVVNKANTSVGLTSSLNPSVFGQQVTFTATPSVTAPGAGTPTGSISFLDGGNPIASCTNVAIAAGQATCQTSALAVGNHTITATYNGDGNFNTSTGNLTGNPQVVNKASTSVAATTSLNPSVFGQNVTFTATVSVTAPGAGTPSGTFSFLDGGNPIAGCTSVAVAAGQAQCMTTALTAGNHTITAQYSGDGNFNTSTGNLTGNPQVVNKASTTTGLTSSQNPAPQGTNITFTATLAVTAPGAGTPSGTFSFLDGGNPIAGCTSVAVNAGQAQCMTNALTPGNHTITAQYSGDGNFNTSTGSLTGNPQVITGPPALVPTVGLTRTQGSPASNSQIGTVSDDVAAPGSISVTVQSAPTGITVTNIVNTNGTITANIAAGCSAATGNNTIVLLATDGKALSQTANLVVNVAANTAPTLGNYSNTSIVLSCKATITPTAAPADNGSVSTVTATGSAGFTGTIMVDATTGIVTISNSGPVSAGHTITVTATDNCGLTNSKQFTLTVVNPPVAPTEFDFDGDRKADVAVYRPGATVNDFSFWFILRSSDNTVQSTQFGHDMDVIVPGDYNGDGMTDVAIYRPSINTWFTSTNPAVNYGAFQWGSAGDIPVPGLYDADNKTDIAVFRPSSGQWFIAKSTGGSDVVSWGLNGDKPVPADYDGDGKTDEAVYRPSNGNWYIRKSSGGTIQQSWGVSTDLLVPADYDGDGKDDIAVFRPSTGFWYIINSSGGTRTDQWGQAGDTPVAADYDNDGKADLSVYRPSAGSWFIFSSCPCVLNGKQFGISTDQPIPAAFTPPAGP